MKFGQLKNKILNHLTDLYLRNEKGEIKKIINIIKENKDFSNLYVFYDEFENITIKENQDEYIQLVENMFISKKNKIVKTFEKLDEILKDVICENNEIYDNLDNLFIETTLNTFNDKINSKKKLKLFLSEDKNNFEEEQNTIVENSDLLNFLLVNNFNVLYEEKLNDDEKKIFKEILSLDENKLNENFISLKTELLNLSKKTIIDNDNNDELKSKINEIEDTINNFEINKINYSKLLEIKNIFN